ncbi:MAG: transposase [Candidatus Micrarchaeia archaeon]
MRKNIRDVIIAIIISRSFRISEVGGEIAKMRGIKESWGYEFVERVIEKIPFECVKRFMIRMFDEGSEWVLADTTEIEMKYVGKNHPYGGYLKYGKMKGILVLTLGVLIGGRSKVFLVLPFSTKILEDAGKGKFEWYVEVMEGLSQLLGGRIVVFDREFSNGVVFECFDKVGIKFLIRVKLGGNVRLVNGEGEDVREVMKGMRVGEVKVMRGVWCGGRVRVNLVIYKKGCSEPFVLATNSEPNEKMIEIYLTRMKIEQTFGDMKSQMGIEGMMVRDLGKVMKMVLLMNIGLNVGVIVGEKIREGMKETTKEKYSGITIFLYLVDDMTLEENRISFDYREVKFLVLSLIFPKVGSHLFDGVRDWF